MEKTFIVYDLQDERDWEEVTLEGAKDKLRNMWDYSTEMNDENGLTEEEYDEFMKRIDVADVDALDDMLGGVDFALREIDEDDADMIRERAIDDMVERYNGDYELGQARAYTVGGQWTVSAMLTPDGFAVSRYYNGDFMAADWNLSYDAMIEAVREYVVGIAEALKAEGGGTL